MKKGIDYDCQASSDGVTCWITGSDGSNIGRFSKTFGLDVHTTATEQMAGKGECLHCTHTPPTEEDWHIFRAKILEHYKIKVPAKLIKWPPINK